MWLAAAVCSGVSQRLWPWPGRIACRRCRRRAHRDASSDPKSGMLSLQRGTLSLLTAAHVQRQMSSPRKSHFPLAFWLCWISKVCSVFFQAVPSTGKCLIYSFSRPSINLSFISSETAGVLRAVPHMITTLPFGWICFCPSTHIPFYPSTPKVQNSENLLGKPLILFFYFYGACLPPSQELTGTIVTIII